MFATLMYHIVGPIRAALAVTPERFNRHLELLRREGFRTIRLDEAIGEAKGERESRDRAVLLTFDDGYQDNVTTALPMLREAGMSAAIFVISATVGTSNRWNPRPCYDTMHATWDELREWMDAGLDLGAHSHQHLCLTRLSDAELAADLTTNESLISEKLGVRPRALAYPYGARDERVTREVARRYEIAFTVDDGEWSAQAGRHCVNRISVSQEWDDDRFLESVVEKWKASTGRVARASRDAERVEVDLKVSRVTDSPV